MIEINNENCFIGMKKIPDKSIDLIIADPPYYKRMISDWKNRQYDWDNQWETFEEYLEFIEKLAVESKRILKDDGSLYIHADNIYASYVQVIFDKYFHMLNNITWAKTTNMTNMSWMRSKRYSCGTERILFYSNSENNKNRHFSPTKNHTDFWMTNPTMTDEQTYHPTQKNMKIVMRMIETSSKEDDTILDPFIGSGTTAVACKNLNRNYIGFELNKNYCDIAKMRLAMAVNNHTRKLDYW